MTHSVRTISHLHLVLLNFKALVQLYNFQVKCLKYIFLGQNNAFSLIPHSFMNWHFILLWLIVGCMALLCFLSGLQSVEHFYSQDYSVYGNMFC